VNEHEIERDPLTGREVVIVSARQGRPNLPGSDCPFCPGGLEAPEPYAAKAFANRWPPLPGGRAEVILYAPEHDATFATLGHDGARRVVDLWAERTTALAALDDVAYVLVFENRGPEVGATIAHPHGQVYGFDDVPDVPRHELSAAACVLCAEEPGDRLVAEHGGWQAYVPALPAWPYEMVVAPTRHQPDIPTLDDDDRGAMADVLLDVAVALERLFDEPMPAMLWIHQKPTDGGDWPIAHVHVHVTPIWRAAGTPRFVAAAELGSGVFFNPIAPTAAAAALRDAVARSR
jgi:UDPglucose--hexose-1-phosphate uridylyltransferase